MRRKLHCVCPMVAQCRCPTQFLLSARWQTALNFHCERVKAQELCLAGLVQGIRDSSERPDCISPPRCEVKSHQFGCTAENLFNPVSLAGWAGTPLSRTRWFPRLLLDTVHFLTVSQGKTDFLSQPVKTGVWTSCSPQADESRWTVINRHTHQHHLGLFVPADSRYK